MTIHLRLVLIYAYCPSVGPPFIFKTVLVWMIDYMVILFMTSEPSGLQHIYDQMRYDLWGSSEKRFSIKAHSFGVKSSWLATVETESI